MHLTTNYGIIPINELIVEKIPLSPRVKLEYDTAKLYDPYFDKRSAPIYVKQRNGEISKLTQENKIKAEDIEWLRAGSSIHKIELPLYLDPRLAYFAGYLFGDGGFKDIRKTYQKTGWFEHKIIIGDEFEVQIERIKNLLKDLFNLDTEIRKERLGKGERLYYVNPTCKIVYRFFVKIFGFPEGPKKSIRIPQVVEQASSEIKRWFLRGFMDADGDVRATEYYVNRKSPSPRVKVRLADKNFVNQLKTSLNNEFKLNMTGPYSDADRNWYVQCGKQGMLNAEKGMLFTHPIKRWRLEIFITQSDR